LSANQNPANQNPASVKKTLAGWKSATYIYHASVFFHAGRWTVKFFISKNQDLV